MINEGVYRRYKKLVQGRLWHEVEAIKELMRGDRWASRVFRGLPGLEPHVIREVEDLQPIADAALAVNESGEPFDDAYQAGLYLHLQPYEFWSHDQTKLYRGQRDDTWETTASLFRPGPMDAPTRQKRLISLAGTLAHEFGLDDRHAFAAAQHYSSEAIVPGGPGAVATWLLDITWNPYIALSFATHGGRSDQMGVVSLLWVSEWEGKFGKTAPLDTLKLNNLTRPRQQEAGFIDSAFPELFDDYVPFRFLFKQKAGLEFEDPDLGASRANIYPANDEVCDAVQRWARLEVSSGHPPKPKVSLTLPPQALRVIPGTNSSWVSPKVFSMMCREYVLLPSRVDLEPHIDRLAIFHSWARFLHPLVKSHGLPSGHPGLGGLTHGACVAERRSAEGEPPNLSEMTSQYNTLDSRFRRSLAAWIDSEWSRGCSERRALRAGDSDVQSFLNALSEFP